MDDIIKQQFLKEHLDWVNEIEKDNCKYEIFINLYEEGSPIALEYLKNGINNPNLDTDVLDKLAHSKIGYICDLVSKNPNCKKETINYLLTLNRYNIKINLLNNNSISKEVFYKIINNTSDDKIKQVINDMNVSFTSIKYIINDVAYRLILKKEMINYFRKLNDTNLLKEALQIENLDFDYINAIAENRNIDEETINAIIDMGICLKTIIKNESVKEYQLLRILKEYPELEEHIASKYGEYDVGAGFIKLNGLSMSSKFIHELTKYAKSYTFATILTLMDNISSDDLETIFNNCKQGKYEYNSFVLIGIAQNNKTSKKVLIELSKIYPEYTIHMRSNHNASREILEKIINEKFDYSILKAVASNPSTPVDLLEKIYLKFGLKKNKYLTSDFFGNNLKRLKQHLVDKQHIKFKSIATSEKYIDEPSKEENVNKIIENISDKMDDISKEKEELIQEILKSIKELEIKIKALEQNDSLNSKVISNLYHSVYIPEDLLLIKVNDHNEIREEFLGVLKLIDLKFIECKNLKVSNIDFRDTNICFNPQVVYKKDLSNSIFDDRNLYGSFKDVNLCGADVSNKAFLVDIESAIIDSNTKLPERFMAMKI